MKETTEYVLVIFSADVLERIRAENNGASKVSPIEIWERQAYFDDDMETFQTYPHTIISLDNEVLSQETITALRWLLSTDDVYGELTLRTAIHELLTLVRNIPLQPQVLIVK